MNNTHAHRPDATDFDWNLAYTGKPTDYEAPDPLVLEIVQAIAPGRALDVGCGAGGLVVALAQRGFQVTGIDIAKNAIAAARQVIAANDVNAALEVADSTSWRPPHSYDLITNCFASPMNRDDRARSYAMIREALAPGGIVVIKDLEPGMARYPFFADMDHVSVDELKRAFDGFELLRAEVVDTPAHDHSRDHDHGHGHDHDHGHGHDHGHDHECAHTLDVPTIDGPWTAALLHARKPTHW